MSSSCKRTYLCSKLKNKCTWTFRKVLSLKCEKKIAKADLNKKVKQYCLRSCRTKCPGTLIFSFNDKHQSDKLKLSLKTKDGNKKPNKYFNSCQWSLGSMELILWLHKIMWNRIQKTSKGM